VDALVRLEFSLGLEVSGSGRQAGGQDRSGLVSGKPHEFQGLQKGLCALPWQDVAQVQGDQTRRGLGQKDRRIPIGERVLVAFPGVLQREGLGGERLFAQHDRELQERGLCGHGEAVDGLQAVGAGVMVTLPDFEGEQGALDLAAESDGLQGRWKAAGRLCPQGQCSAVACIRHDLNPSGQRPY
jgi:hypothetical protein